MRVHLIKKQTIEDYIADHAVAGDSFLHWLAVIKYADWDMPEDIRKTFGTADLLGRGSNRVVFNISGNNYRMICKYYFGDLNVHLFVCWLGTHAEYDEICEKRHQYDVNKY
jgi:mRNA interferase HigB